MAREKSTSLQTFIHKAPHIFNNKLAKDLEKHILSFIGIRHLSMLGGINPAWRDFFNANLRRFVLFEKDITLSRGLFNTGHPIYENLYIDEHKNHVGLVLQLYQGVRIYKNFILESEKPIATQDLIKDFLEQEGDAIDTEFLKDIPEASYYALYHILRILKENLKQPKPLSYFRELITWVNVGYDEYPTWETSLNDACHKDIALAYFVMQDAWMRSFIHKKELISLPKKQYIDASNAFMLAIIVGMISFVIVGIFAIPLLPIAAIVGVPIGCAFGALFAYESFGQARHRHAPGSTVQRKADAYKNILEMEAKAESPQTLFSEEKAKVREFLTQKRNQLLNEKGLRFHLFYDNGRTESKIHQINIALQKLTEVHSLIQLAQFKEGLLSNTALVYRRTLGLGYSDTYEALFKL